MPAVWYGSIGQTRELEKKDSLEFKLTRGQHLCCGKLHLYALRIGAQSGFEADSVANLTQHAKVWTGIDDAAVEKNVKLHNKYSFTLSRLVSWQLLTTCLVQCIREV